MGDNEQLKLLCHRLIANQFDTIHDAEQALEQFEKLTTPTVVLGLLNNDAKHVEHSGLLK